MVAATLINVDITWNQVLEISMFLTRRCLVLFRLRDVAVSYAKHTKRCLMRNYMLDCGLVFE